MTSNDTELILINISGQDKPGVTAALTAILARYNAMVLDIGQADIHHTLSLGILFRTTSDQSGDIMKDLLFKAYDMGVKIRFTPISIGEYENWVSRQGKNRWIITILGRQLTASNIALVSEVIVEQGLNIDAIQRLTGRQPLLEGSLPAAKACIEFSVRGTPENRSEMQSRFIEISSREGFDISMQEDTMYRRCRRLICFDMDSTLIQTDCIDSWPRKRASATRSAPSPKAPCAARLISARVSPSAWRSSKGWMSMSWKKSPSRFPSPREWTA